MGAASSTELRAKLRNLGRRRARQATADERLTKEIVKALREADGKLTVSEQAALLGLHRTTLYRVYK